MPEQSKRRTNVDALIAAMGAPGPLAEQPAIQDLLARKVSRRLRLVPAPDPLPRLSDLPLPTTRAELREWCQAVEAEVVASISGRPALRLLPDDAA